MWGRLESTTSAVSRAATLTLRRSRVRSRASSRSSASTEAGPASWWQQGEVWSSIVIRDWPNTIGRFPAYGAWLGP